MLKLSDWNGLLVHIVRTCRLGTPLIGMHLALIAISTTDILMVARLGDVSLGAVTLGAQMMNVTMFIMMGLSNSVMSIGSQGLGLGDYKIVRRSARMGLWIGALLSLVFMPFFWFTESIFLLLGQELEIAEVGQIYMRVALFSIMPMLLIIVMRAFLSVVEHTAILFWSTCLAIGANALLNYAFIYGNLGAPELGVAGAGLATIVANSLMFGLAAIYVAKHRNLKKYQLFRNFWQLDISIVKEILVLGIPISVGILAEAGLFIVGTFLVGWFGSVQLAAHAIALQAATVTFMVPLGLSSAATVLVGQYAGQRDRYGVSQAGKAVFFVAIVYSFIAAACFFFFSASIVRLFLGESDVEVGMIAVSLLLVAAAFQFVDCLQITVAACLRGLKDTKVPMFIALLSYWIAGIGTACFFAFWLKWEAFGIWIGLATGLGVAAFFLCLRFFRRETLGIEAF